jgi:Tol biopolymer transport system component
MWRKRQDKEERTMRTAAAACLALLTFGGTPMLVAEIEIESSLEVLTVATGAREVVYSARAHFEAPNWSSDGSSLLFNQDGRLYVLQLDTRQPRVLDTGDATRCNNDHGFSPDGRWLALSHAPQDRSLIYVLPATGGTPRLVTDQGPSYWHGWSPDGRTLAYCAERHGEYDVYTIPVEGGAERRLTSTPGLDDGPDYAPDGAIWFNSERSGLMKIWRMDPDGSNQRQMTYDDQWADWFPHPSPDGRQVVFLSYDWSVKGHPPN